MPSSTLEDTGSDERSVQAPGLLRNTVRVTYDGLTSHLAQGEGVGMGKSFSRGGGEEWSFFRGKWGGGSRLTTD